MKQVGEWWIPDQDNHPGIITAASNNSWPCYDVLNMALPYVKKFDFAIDVGAWIGDSTGWLAEKFSYVEAFEPNPCVCECTRKNLQNKNISNYKLHTCALSNQTGLIEFYNQAGTMSGWISSKIYDLNLHPYIQHTSSVECYTLDSFEFQGVDFLKIDVDSHEAYLLLGAQEFFKRNRPVVLLEHKLRTQQRQVDYSPDPLKIMQQFGYQIVKHDRIDYILIPQ